ncbi:MAG: LOG family protein [Candidatus Omnitrophota bacterium]
MNPTPKTIAVYGSSAISQDSPEAERARLMGQRLAEAGFHICNGGYMGAMEACSLGAREAGGEVIGVTCRSFSKRSPNPYLTQEILTEDLPDRISTLMRIADAYVILDGNIGTLAELFLAWNVVAMGSQKPIVIVGEAMRQAVYAMQQFTEVSEKQISLLSFASGVEETVEILRQKLNH